MRYYYTTFLYDTWVLTYYYYFLTIWVLKRIYGVKTVSIVPNMCNYVVVHNILIAYREYEIYFCFKIKFRRCNQPPTSLLYAYTHL